MLSIEMLFTIKKKELKSNAIQNKRNLLNND